MSEFRRNDHRVVRGHEIVLSGPILTEYQAIAGRRSQAHRDEADVTRAVLRVMERTTDPRLREIMVALIRHLHGFVRDVRLTEEEFEAATAILNEIGQQQTDTNNEVVLMAGSLGVSALVCLTRK